MALLLPPGYDSPLIDPENHQCDPTLHADVGVNLFPKNRRISDAIR
jgi:hypothetical protein